MDEGGNRENGRQKPDMYKPAQSPWLMQQPSSMRHIMTLMAERDAAIQERNMAINEKKKACEERDLAIMQRDSAIIERDEAIVDRDNAMASLQFRQISSNTTTNTACPPGCQISEGIKHMHHPQQHVQNSPSHGGGDGSYNRRGVSVPISLPMVSPAPAEAVKTPKVKRPKDPDSSPPNKKAAKSARKVKKEGEGMWTPDMEHTGGMKSDWAGSDIGLNQVAFDDTTMPPPVCSCTGVYRQCYKWGNGGWQSSCCTTTMSMYPLPNMPNKKHARIGGRKMSGSAFSKLLSRLAVDGHDLSSPVDLKDHWAKHGTNRYITIK